MERISERKETRIFASSAERYLSEVDNVLLEMERRGVQFLDDATGDAIIGGGDFAFNGLYPAECVRKVRDLGWPCVRG